MKVKDRYIYVNCVDVYICGFSFYSFHSTPFQHPTHIHTDIWYTVSIHWYVGIIQSNDLKTENVDIVENILHINYILKEKIGKNKKLTYYSVRVPAQHYQHRMSFNCFKRKNYNGLKRHTKELIISFCVLFNQCVFDVVNSIIIEMIMNSDYLTNSYLPHLL